MNDLQSELNVETADTPKLRSLLIDSLVKGDAVFTSASKAYPKLTQKMLPAPPIFFEDFDFRFQDALTGLRSPSQVAFSPYSSTVSLKLVDWSGATFQAAKRPAHTDPLIALGVINLMKEGVQAFTLTAKNGTYYFDAEIDSTPSGAKVYYTRLRHPYQAFTELTSIKKVTLQYAIWDLSFEKKGCVTQTGKLNPYSESIPKETVKFDCQTRKKR